MLGWWPHALSSHVGEWAVSTCVPVCVCVCAVYVLLETGHKLWKSEEDIFYQQRSLKFTSLLNTWVWILILFIAKLASTTRQGISTFQRITGPTLYWLLFNCQLRLAIFRHQTHKYANTHTTTHSHTLNELTDSDIIVYGHVYKGIHYCYPTVVFICQDLLSMEL